MGECGCMCEGVCVGVVVYVKMLCVSGCRCEGVCVSCCMCESAVCELLYM